MADNISEFVFNFRTHAHKVILLEQMPPDFPLEQAVRQYAFLLKTKSSATHPLRLLSRSVKDVLNDYRLEV